MIVEIRELTNVDISAVTRAADQEGHNIINHLIMDYTSGGNRFDKLGEKLIGFMLDNEIVAICGLNIEPTSDDIGRIRRLYVLPSYGHLGIGRKLVRYLIEHARGYFESVVVNVGNLPIDNFYESVGFRPVRSDSYTHTLKI
jgi:GNAT superfamily N-acetyltransferase